MDVINKLKVALLQYYQKYTGLLQWLILFLFGAWIIYVSPYGIGSVGERKVKKACYLTAKNRCYQSNRLQKFWDERQSG
jgi:hypothetical protein